MGEAAGVRVVWRLWRVVGKRGSGVVRAGLGSRPRCASDQMSSAGLRSGVRDSRWWAVSQSRRVCPVPARDGR